MIGLRVRRVDDDALVPVVGTIIAYLIGGYWVRWDGPGRECFEWYYDLAPYAQTGREAR